MKCITKAFIPLKSVTFNLRRKINFAVKWSMRVFLAVHLIKENKILASTAFVSKKRLISTTPAAIKPFLKNKYLKLQSGR